LKLYYYQDPLGNFGDDLNVWLWSRLLGDCLDTDGSSIFVGIGTLLNHRLPLPPIKNIFGAGVGYGRTPKVDDRWKIYFVRGPLSAQALRLPQKIAITDPAALLRIVDLPDEPKMFEASFMPYHVNSEVLNQREAIRALCQSEGINYIDPSSSVEDVLRGILRSRVVIAEAMHAAIVADALRIPWIPVVLSDRIHKFKWHDWCQSLGLGYSPVIFPAQAATDSLSTYTKFLGRLKTDAAPTLSSDHAIEAATARLVGQLERFRADHSATSSSRQPAPASTVADATQRF
jgi:succinoglycan biosynthesis protein ExoV